MTVAPMELAEKLRAQIGRMVAGNGLPPEAVTTQNAKITTVRLLGQLDVRLLAHPKTSQGKGQPAAQFHQSYDNIAELTSSLPILQRELSNDKNRLAHAADEILMQSHQGWGLTAATLPAPHLDYTAGAVEKCPFCHGNKSETCTVCNGRCRQECSQCIGKKEITCPTCFGRGVLSSGEDCAACRQRGVVMCTACQGQGETGCHACSGKGQVPCRTCEAKGQIYHQVNFTAVAQANFKMMLAEDLPEDIAIHVRRLKAENLLGGRAKISVTGKEINGDAMRVNYTAEFPIAQLDYLLAEQPVHLVMLGEKPMVVEATHFMDRLLAPAMDLLRRARAKETPAAAALAELGKIRFFRDAFAAGKNGLELRRRYPFGIRIPLLREVPPALQYLLSILTQQPRMLASVAFNAVTAIFLLYHYFLGGAHKGFGAGDIVLCVILLLLNVAAILGVHIGVTLQTLKPFGLRPNYNANGLLIAWGKTGMISAAVTLLFCVIAWLIK